MFKKYLIPILIIFLLMSTVVMGAPTYVNVGPTTDFEGDVGVPAGKDYYIGDVLFSTLGLIDISTLAKTDGGIIVGDGTNFVLETGATARASLGLTIGTHVQAYDAGLLSLAGLTYASDSLIKVTAEDTYAIRTLAEVKDDLDLVIGTDVLAQQTIGIADDNLVEIDDTDVAIDDYCKLTADGIVGRSYTEVKTDLGIDLTLYYLKTEINTQGKLETIWGVTLATDTELAALTYSDVGAIQDAVNTIDSDKYVDGSIDHEHLAPDVISGMVDVTADDLDYILIWDNTDSSLKKVDMAEVLGAGALTFLGLTDTPANYTGSANKFLQINATPDALIFDTISSDDLSDMASIAMLDENEDITGAWTFENEVFQEMYHDEAYPHWEFKRAKDGDPSWDVSDGDILGYLTFLGYHTGWSDGATIQAVVDGTPGDGDMPTRIEFYTSADGSETPLIRMKILNTGVIEIYDAGTTLRYTFGVDGTADADVAWGTFSPDVRGEGKELLAIALEDANKPVKPYVGIPVVKTNDELFDMIPTEYEEEVPLLDDEGNQLINPFGKPLFEIVTKIKDEKIFRERRPNEFATEEEKQVEYDKYHKVPAKIAIANAKYLEYLTGMIDELEARIKILEKGENSRIR